MPRIVRIAGPALLLCAALIAVVAGLIFGGGANPLSFRDPGSVVRWGLPISQLIVQLAAAGVIGTLVLVCFALSPEKRGYNTTLDWAAGSAALLTVASLATGLFTFIDVTGSSLFDPQFGDSLTIFVTNIDLGRAWLATTLIAASVTVLCFAVRNLTALIVVTLLAIGSLLPIAQQGHAAGTSGHAAAVTGLALHLVFAAVWVGGILTIIVITRQQKKEDSYLPVIERYSTLALISFIVVAASGYVSAELRIGSVERLLTTDYGVLVLVKVCVLVVLGFFGYVHRRFFISQMRLHSTIGRYFWWFIVGELAFMGVAFGVGAALGRTATPIPQELPPTPTPAQILTGDPLPPLPEIWRYFTEWNIDLVWVLVCGFGIFFYLTGMRRLRKRGDAWPFYRALLWVLGMLLLFYVTSGGAAVYGRYLFSAHMVEHMTLTMMVPLLLVPAAPVTLALRTIRKRSDGSRGSREWILLAVHSRFGKILTNPFVAAGLFIGSLWIFYYSPIFRWVVSDHIGHEWMIIHFVFVGYLFVQSLIGIDPVPYRLPYPLRLLLLLVTMAFHAFFGLALMTGNSLLLGDWYGAMGWGTSALADQQLGGGIAWGIGEIPTLVLAIVVAIQWAGHDAKETKRRDRNADRTGDTELDAYNAQLARLAERDHSHRP